MKRFNFYVFLFFSSFVFLSCNDTDEEAIDRVPKPISNSANKILILGASRVEGARPDYESFRYELWKDLVENELTFDFIGGETDYASYPEFMGLSFDPDHEGRGGWTSGQILEGLPGWLTEIAVPDIVLFSSPGGNDALNGMPYEDAIENIKKTIDVLQAQNPNVLIFIEQMAPARSDMMDNTLTSYINGYHADILIIAANKTTQNSQVVPINMYTGFTDSMLADDVHYNEAGAQFIADRYYNVLSEVLE
ncbi:MAG: GDSL-type esterase/lipase family protein [Flavicella sp.]